MVYTKSSFTFVLICFLLLQFQTVRGQDLNPTLLKIGTLDSIFSETLQENRHFYIQYPYDFNPENNKKYPVAYILDGGSLLPTVHDVQSYYSGGFTPEMILIGISNTKNRARDLTTSKTIEKPNMPLRENGEASNFMKFIEMELIPYVENKYPVTNFRTLIGHSYGGLFTINALVNHSETFSNYIAIDPSLDWDDQRLLKEAQDKFSTINLSGKSLFMSLSSQLHPQNPNITIDNVMQDTSDFTLFPRSNISFSNLARNNAKNGLAFDWKFYPRDLHGTIPFPSIMDGLIFCFEWFQMENTDKFNSFETSKEELQTIIEYRAQKLEHYFGYKVPPYPEDVLNTLGYMSMDFGQWEKAKMFFEAAMKFFHDSANPYDSMADFYERKENYEQAYKYVSKAYEISKSDYHKSRMDQLKDKF